MSWVSVPFSKAEFSVSEAAEEFGVTPQCIRKAASSKKLKARKIGKQWVLLGHDLCCYFDPDYDGDVR